jgi:hypothetical protein
MQCAVNGYLNYDNADRRPIELIKSRRVYRHFAAVDRFASLAPFF